MENPYAPPQAPITVDEANTSGTGKNAVVPAAVKGWSWGGFLLGWIWAIGNKTWVGLICLIPYVGWIMKLVLGIKGREWAWQNNRWDSVEHFNRVQRRWALWGIVVVIAFVGIMAAIAIPAYQHYIDAAKAAQARQGARGHP